MEITDIHSSQVLRIQPISHRATLGFLSGLSTRLGYFLQQPIMLCEFFLGSILIFKRSLSCGITAKSLA